MKEMFQNNFSLTSTQRKSLSLLLILLAIVIAYQLFSKRAHVPEVQLDFPARAGEVADRIDINTADWATLAVLPSIGEKKARDIIAAREQLRTNHPAEAPFQSISDLDRHVKGIGPATIARIKPYLLFPGDLQSSTQPSMR